MKLISFLVNCWIALNLQAPLSSWINRTLILLAQDPITRNDGKTVHILSHAIAYCEDKSYLSPFTEIVINARYYNSVKSVLIMNADRSRHLHKANKNIQSHLITLLLERIYNNRTARIPKGNDTKPIVIADEMRANKSAPQINLSEESIDLEDSTGTGDSCAFLLDEPQFFKI